MELLNRPLIVCSDCGNQFNRSTMHWGDNSWNNKRVTQAEKAYVCQTCWDNRLLVCAGVRNKN